MDHYYTKHLLVLLVSIILSSTTAIGTELVIVNRPAAEDDTRYVYAHRLIAMALNVTNDEYGPAELVYAEQTMIRMRALAELQDGTNIHVMAEATQPMWEELLIPIRIPIRKGISGYRIFLINQEDQSKLSNISSLEELKRVSTGMIGQWSIAQILKDAGFNTVFATNYQGLFTMLMAERFSTFNRGIDEIFEEYSIYKEKYPNLHIEEDLLIHIPMPIYVFVSPNKPELAERLQKGLELLIELGEFDKYFYEHYRGYIEKARIDERKVFYVPNYSLSDETPLDHLEYWY